MTESAWLAQRFEEHRPHLRAVAYRMLGSGSEADDAVQEAWLRLTRADPGAVENMGGWLTTVVARVSLNLLRSRAARAEEPLEAGPPAGGATDRATLTGAHRPRDPEDEVVLADSVGLALLVVLETLTPAERVAFVLHDLFDLPFDEIAPVVGRSPEAARQLASRARRRVRGARGEVEDPAESRGFIRDPSELARRREIVSAFLAASRGGDFGALLALLDPDVVLRADAAAVQVGSAPEVKGARAVAETFAGRARVARIALLDGAPGAVWAPGGQPRVAFEFTIEGGVITEIGLVADAERLAGMAVVFEEG